MSMGEGKNYSVKTQQEDQGGSNIASVIDSGMRWHLEVERDASCAY